MRFSVQVLHDGWLPDWPPKAKEWAFRRPDQRIEVELRDEAAIRSSRQNRFLHGPVLDEFARVWHVDGWRYFATSDPGEDPQPLPRWMVRARVLETFCPHSFAYDGEGNAHRQRKSTADMTVREMSAMFDEMNEYLVHKEGERGMLPSPEEWSEHA
jgi:hypothetical protein